MNEPPAYVLSSLPVRLNRLFICLPVVRQPTEDQLVLVQPRSYRAMAYMCLVGAILFLLLLLFMSYLQGKWEGSLVWIWTVLLLYGGWLVWRRTAVTFDRRGRVLTAQMSQSAASAWQRSLTDLYAVQVLRSAGCHYLRLVFANSEPALVTLTAKVRRRGIMNLAQQIAGFLGVPLIERKGLPSVGQSAPRLGDEQLFQKVRNELLSQVKDEVPTPAAPSAEHPAAQAGAPGQGRRLWWLVVALAVVATLASVLGWLDPESFGIYKSVGVVILAVIGLGSLASWLQQKVDIRTSQAPRIGSPPALSPWARLFLSFVWFVLLGVLLFTPPELAWLIGVLLLHECGHFLGMRYFGYRDVHMFFIPLFGAAVHGEKIGVPAWQEAVVLLLGPLPGLLLGCGIYYLDLAVPQPTLRTGAALLVAINFLNLLPFEPLDGGRLCNRLLFSRFRWLEVLTLVLATVGLVFVCWGPGWVCLSLSAAFALFVLAPSRYKNATAALALQSRWPDLPPQLAELSEEQWRDLFVTTRVQLSADPTLLAARMKDVYTRALQHRESWGMTTGLFAVYLSALVLGIGTASVTHLAEDAGRWPIRIKHRVTESVDTRSPPAMGTE